MGAFEHQIEELVAFARDRDNNDRSVLFCELTELFTSGKAPHTLKDREHLLDVIDALVPHVAPNTRAGVAGQLADMHHPPMDLVMRLIYDDADLVSNLITHAPMDEDSLIEFIAKTGRAHHQELATRTDLSANVWIALARAAPTMPVNRLHNENALWEDTLGKDHKPDSSTHVKNAEELGINLFMTRPAPEEKIKVRSATRSPLKNMTGRQISPSVPVEENDISLSKKLAANDLVNNTLSRKERRALDEHVRHPLPRATVDIEDFNWNQHVTSSLGWALLTGRDGTIIDLSHSARLFMGQAADRLINMDIIELIGLSDRSEHPVVKALSRHGAIHDAPVVLFVGPVGRASWTLTALPKFMTPSGLFEGFNCHFSPVPLADEDIPVFLDEVDENTGFELKPKDLYKDYNITSITGEVPIIREAPLFLDGDDYDDDDDDLFSSPLTPDPTLTKALSEAVARKMNMSGDTIRAQAQKMASNRMSEIQSKLRGSELRKWPKIITDATEQPFRETPAIFDNDTDHESDEVIDDTLKDIFEPQPVVSKTTFTKVPLVEENIAYKPAAPVQAPTMPSAPQKREHPQQDALSDLVETTRLARHAIELEENIQKSHLQRVATIKHMLSMMEEAGARLKGKHPDDDPLTIQLDADIAKTCAKALRDLLENRVEK